MVDPDRPVMPLLLAKVFTSPISVLLIELSIRNYLHSVRGSNFEPESLQDDDVIVNVRTLQKILEPILF